MDKDNSGKITVQDIAHIYDVSQNQDFIDGKKTKEEILTDFLSGFEGAKGNDDGIVTWEEFKDYYSDLSMSLPTDVYFVQMMESVWQVAEDEDAGVFKEQLEHLTKTLRHKLLDYSKGSSDEYVLRDVFNFFDTNKSETIALDELTFMMEKLGISCERKYCTALLKKFDKNGNGVIEFEEFCDYIIHNPYK